ncbi:MFS transporter [Vibrio algarum]|uniref:MFS transporter n=1 Tax=Vibrio algarum TaxID=3020714 RepID=A0ABT4YTC9_9VIBR|nr:MFS transporter [Vibrio sp. KJ40-1]MDB1124822.1 MFS transporter [Vibrio sp. KJ40-1]
MNSYLNFIRLQWPLLSFGFLTVFIGNVGQSFFLSWFGADIQKDLVLSATDYGMIYALATLCSSMTIMFVGGLVDKWDIRPFVTVVAVLLVVACVVMSYVVSPLMLFFAFFMLRLAGQGLLPHTAQTTMIRSYSHQRGKAISLASSGVAFGEVILPIIVVLLISWIGWRSSWLVFASVVAFVYLPLAYILLAKSTQFKGNTKKPISKEMLSVIKVGGMYCLTGVFGPFCLRCWQHLLSLLACSSNNIFC